MMDDNYKQEGKVPCQWCKQGTYRRVFELIRDHHGVPTNYYGLAEFGVRPQGDDEWAVWASSCCGHLQYFRPDFGRKELKIA